MERTERLEIEKSLSSIVTIISDFGPQRNQVRLVDSKDIIHTINDVDMTQVFIGAIHHVNMIRDFPSKSEQQITAVKVDERYTCQVGYETVGLEDSMQKARLRVVSCTPERLQGIEVVEV